MPISFVKFVPKITGIVLDGSYICFPDTTTIDIYSWLIYWFNLYKSFLYFKHLVSAFKLCTAFKLSYDAEAEA